MKKFLTGLFVIVLFFLNGAAARAAEINQITPPAVKAGGAIVIEINTGKVLYEKDIHKRLYPASMTKILTALVAIENGDLKEIITVGKEIRNVPWDSSKAGLKLGDQLTLRNLIMGLMLPSGNDAANTIAVYIGRKVGGEHLGVREAVVYFSDLMNKRAEKAGANGSHFVTPDGYHHPQHFSTAYDLAMISREAMKYPFFREVVGTPQFTLRSRMGEYKWFNTNRLLHEMNNKYYYPYATGMKTGHTSQAGYCLSSSAHKEGMELIAVILNDTEEDRWVESKNVLEYGFTNFRNHTVVYMGEIVGSIKVEDHSPDDSGDLPVISAGTFTDIFSVQDIPRIKKNIIWEDKLLCNPSKDKDDTYLKAPVSRGQVVGKVLYTLDGKVIAEFEVTAGRDIRKKTIMDIIKSSKVLPYLYLVTVSAIFAVVIIIIRKNEKSTL